MANTPIKTASDLEAATRDALAHLQSHGVASQLMLARHRAALASVHSDQRWSDAGRATQLNQLHAAFKQAVAQHAADTQAASDALASAHQRARMASTDSAAQLLAFQREQDGAERARKMAAAGVPLLQVIEQAGKTGDTAMLSGLRRHLPADLAAHEVKTPGIVEAHLKAVAQAEEPHLSDVERAVRAQEARLPQLHAAAKWNGQALQQAANSSVGDPGVASFIGGEDGRQAIPIGAAPIGLPSR